MRLLVLSMLLALLSGVACSNTYCQSGAKHGTQCYDLPRGEEPPHPQVVDSDGSGGGQAEERRVPATTPR